MFQTLDGLIRRNQRRLAILTFILVVAAMVVIAHSGIGEDHMGDAAAACLAVLEGAALGILAVVTSNAARRRNVGPSFAVRTWRAPARLTGSARYARAGPVVLQVFRR